MPLSEKSVAFLRTWKRLEHIVGRRDPWAVEAILNPSATVNKRAVQ